MLTKSKIALIHIAKNQLNIEDENYRNILNNFGVTTCKDLNDDQFKLLMDIFANLGFKSNKMKFDKLQVWGCTQRQRNMIIYLWRSKANNKSFSALQNFIFRIVKKSIAYINQHDVEKIVNAINHLK